MLTEFPDYTISKMTISQVNVSNSNTPDDAVFNLDFFFKGRTEISSIELQHFFYTMYTHCIPGKNLSKVLAVDEHIDEFDISFGLSNLLLSISDEIVIALSVYWAQQFKQKK